MAEHKLKEYKNNRSKVVEDRMNDAEMQSRRESQQAQMDQKIKELADKAIEFYDLYGAEDYRYQMMVTFLDVAFQMKDAIALITSVQVATSYLATAVQFIDDSILYEDSFNEQMLAKSYGPFARLKRKIMIRRASQNNKKRLETAITNMTVRVEMAHEITESLRIGFENMRAAMAKNDAKRKAKEAKRVAKGGTPAPDSNRALSYIAEVRGARGGAPAPAPETKPDTKPAEGGTSTGDIDDIL